MVRAMPTQLLIDPTATLRFREIRAAGGGCEAGYWIRAGARGHGATTGNAA
jgi:hypothetical protein